MTHDTKELDLFQTLEHLYDGSKSTHEEILSLYCSFSSPDHYSDFLRDLKMMAAVLAKKRNLSAEELEKIVGAGYEGCEVLFSKVIESTTLTEEDVEF